MPTGYTYDVQRGKITTLHDFALHCARAMGACIMMRDDPADAPIPERFEPHTDFYDKGIAEARAVLAEVPALSAQECDARAAADYETALKSHTDRLAEQAAGERRYRSMLAQVEGWTTQAEGIREFMLEQLRTSISHDCDSRYEPEPPIRQTGEQWRQTTLEKVSRVLADRTVERAKEIGRTEGRNQWLANLRASLPLATKPEAA